MQPINQFSEKVDSLGANAERFQLLFESMPEGLAINQLLFDGNGQAVDYQIVAVNPAFEKQTGIPAAAAQNRRASEVYTGFGAPYFQWCERVAQTGNSESMEFLLAQHQRHVSVSVFSLGAEWFVTGFSDVTERKRQEVETERLDRLQSVLIHVNQAVVRTGLRTELFQQVCRIMTDVGGFLMAAVSVADPATKEVERVGTSGDVTDYFEKVEVYLDNVPKGRGPSGTALREGRTYVCNDFTGDPRTDPWREAAAEAGVRASIALPIINNGKVSAVLAVYASEAGYFQAKEVAVLEEVADDISFALDHIEQEAVLQEAIRRFRTLLDDVRLVALGLDREGRVTYANPFFFEMTGYAPENVFGEKWAENFIPKHCQSVANTMFAELLNDEKHIHYENGICTKDGQERLIAWNNTVLRDQTGKVEGTMSLGEDVTERKQMEDRLLRAQRTESIGSLASGIAHDLNNIFLPIMMSASMLQDDLPQQSRNELISSIEEAAQRGADIVKQVLTFARGVKGERIALNPEPLVAEIWGIVRETFPKSITPIAVVPKNLWNIIGDKTQLHQVLLNLCVNARDAMANGGTLSLSVRNSEVDARDLSISPDAKPGRYVTFKVTDSGSGIAPENMTRIFDPFFTTKEFGNGTGLGLSTVMGIVRSHGGFITADSTVGKGTIFEVSIPATSEATTAEPGAAKKPGTVPGRGETILIVDDEVEILKITKTILTRNGYKVETASNGADALDFLATGADEIQLIVTDLMMPNMDGTKLVRAIRKLGHNIPIIASSGYGGERYQEELSSLGVKSVLIKPFNARMLLGVVHQVLHLEDSQG